MSKEALHLIVKETLVLRKFDGMPAEGKLPVEIRVLEWVENDLILSKTLTDSKKIKEFEDGIN